MPFVQVMVVLISRLTEGDGFTEIIVFELFWFEFETFGATLFAEGLGVGVGLGVGCGACS